MLRITFLLPYSSYLCCVGGAKADGGDGADFIAQHTSDITCLIDGNRIKRAGKASGLRANCHTGTTLNAGVPVNVKDDRGTFGHVSFPFYIAILNEL